MHYRLILAVLPFLQVCLGQDMRSVTEPSFPPACTQLAANGGSETKLDTDRIQSAMNACAMGQAVELTAGGFVSGPLQIPKGVTLLIDADATLFASRNPRNYDSNTSQTCGTLATSSGGCVPFITANRADGGGIMGYGLIDGQGHLPMMPGGVASSQSWWDLARAASGNLAVALLRDADKAYWTCTCWTDEQAMRAFTLSGMHGAVMRRLAGWCDEAAVAHWMQDTAELPSWDEAHRRLQVEGRSTRVDHPSEAQHERRFPPPLVSRSRTARMK